MFFKYYVLGFFALVIVISSVSSQNYAISENDSSEYLLNEIISFRPETDPFAYTTSTTLLDEEIPRYSQESKDIIAAKREMENMVENKSLNDSVNPQCGNSLLVCSVQNDLTGDGVDDCCDVTNNNVCRGCRSQCIIECEKENKVLKTCFMDVNRPVCQCIDGEPTCYEHVLTTLPEGFVEIPAVEESSGTSLSYLLLLGFIFTAFGASIYFITKADRE